METKTFRDHMEAYLLYRAALRYSPRTLAGMRYKLARLIRWLAHAGIQTADRLRREHLELWQRHLAGRQTKRGTPLTARSINRCVTTARGWLKYLAEQGYVPPALPEGLRQVKAPRLLPGSVLTHAEVKRLLARVDTTTLEGFRDRAMLEMLYSSGLRISELLGLAVDDVDLKQGLAKVLGKGSKERMVPVGKTALRYLDSYLVAVRSYLLKDPAERILFVSRGHRISYTTFSYRLRLAVGRAKLNKPVTMHTFRRSCTTELIRGGANMYHVKELLGHESLDTLKHYARLTILDLKKTHAKCHPRERDELR